MKLQIQTYLVLFFLLITAFSVSSQETDESTDIPETIAEVTENSDRISGLFTLYRDKKTGTTHMEIAPTQLNREYIYVAVSTDGVVEGGNSVTKHILLF